VSAALRQLAGRELVLARLAVLDRGQLAGRELVLEGVSAK